MAKTSSKKNAAKKRDNQNVVWKFPLDKTDFTWLAIGIGIVALGAILFATGITEEPAVENGTWNNFFAINVAPFITIIGYCVVIPMAIMKVFSRRKQAKQQTTNE